MAKKRQVQPETDEADGNADAQAAAAEYASYAKDEIIWLPRALIHPDPKQIRKRFVGIEELRESIRTSGLLQDLAVRPHPEIEDHWQLVSGERRWRAAEGLDRVRDDAPEGCLPCKIVLAAADALQHKVQQFLFNASNPVTPIEEGLYYEDLMQEHGLSEVQIAKMLGVPRSSIGDRRRIAQLDPVWLELLTDGKLTTSQAIEVSRYREFPASAQQGALDGLRDARFGFWSREEGLALLPVGTLRNNLSRIFEDQIHPLDPQAPVAWNSASIPAAIVKRHDEECNCGRVVYATSRNATRYEYCANPKWWRAAVTEARRLAEEKRAAQEAKKLARRETSIDLADAPDTPPVVWDGYGKTPKGVVILTKARGKAHAWATSTWGRLAFDPDDLEIEPALLGRWASPNGDEGVLTTGPGIAAVKAANEKWNRRFEERARALRSEQAGRVASEATAFEIGVGAPRVAAAAAVARQVLLAGLSAERGLNAANHVLAAKICHAADLARVLLPDDVRKANEQHKADRCELVAAWVAAIGDDEVIHLAEVLAIVHATGMKPVADLVETEQRAALDEISQRKTPWGDAPLPRVACKGGCGRTFEADEAEDEFNDQGLCYQCEATADETALPAQGADDIGEADAAPDAAALDDEEDDDEEAAVGAGGGAAIHSSATGSRS